MNGTRPGVHESLARDGWMRGDSNSKQTQRKGGREVRFESVLSGLI